MNIYKKAFTGFLVFVISILISTVVVRNIEPAWYIVDRYFTRAILFTILIGVVFWLLRKYNDKYKPSRLGLGSVGEGLIKFFLGLVLFLIPLVFSLGIVWLRGWADIQINPPANFEMFWIGIITVFLFEALPEEFVFRGYIYSNLNSGLTKWKAAILSVLFFVGLPPAMLLIQSIFGIKGSFGINASITIEFLMTLMVFGAFAQYLRIITNSIWTGVGFHLFFVSFNKIIGQKDGSIIQMENVVNQESIRLLFMVCILIVFLLVILYPLISKRKINWQETAT